VVQGPGRFLALLIDHQVELNVAHAACSLVSSIALLLLLLDFLELSPALFSLFFDLLDVCERIANSALHLV
jgi:hypothetical protein